MKEPKSHVRENVKVKVKKQGGAVKVESEEEFLNLCKKLTRKFKGLLRLWGEIDGETYTAGLFIEDGLIVACTLEHMDEAKVRYGPEALDKLKKIFTGAKGDLDIYVLNENDFEKALKANSQALLEEPMKLSSLGIKIKGHVKSSKDSKNILQKIFGFLRREDKQKKRRRKKIRRLKIKSQFSLPEFARDINEMDSKKAKRFKKLRKKQEKKYKKPDTSKLKEDRFKEIRKKQIKLKRKARKKVFKNKKKKQPSRKDEKEDKILGVEKEKPKPKKRAKVKTNIDNFYKLVEKKGQVKLNGKLSKKLKVPKTQIEEWAMVLEEHGLLELRYPTIGEPVITSKNKLEKQKDDE